MTKDSRSHHSLRRQAAKFCIGCSQPMSSTEPAERYHPLESKDATVAKNAPVAQLTPPSTPEQYSPKEAPSFRPQTPTSSGTALIVLP